MKYTVELTETVVYTMEIEANSAAEAVKIGKKLDEEGNFDTSLPERHQAFVKACEDDFSDPVFEDIEC